MTGDSWIDRRKTERNCSRFDGSWGKEALGPWWFELDWRVGMEKALMYMGWCIWVVLYSGWRGERIWLRREWVGGGYKPPKFASELSTGLRPPTSLSHSPFQNYSLHHPRSLGSTILSFSKSSSMHGDYPWLRLRSASCKKLFLVSKANLLLIVTQYLWDFLHPIVDTQLQLDINPHGIWPCVSSKHRSCLFCCLSIDKRWTACIPYLRATHTLLQISFSVLVP